MRQKATILDVLRTAQKRTLEGGGPEEKVTPRDPGREGRRGSPRSWEPLRSWLTREVSFQRGYFYLGVAGFLALLFGVFELGFRAGGGGRAAGQGEAGIVAEPPARPPEGSGSSEGKVDPDLRLTESRGEGPETEAKPDPRPEPVEEKEILQILMNPATSRTLGYARELVDHINRHLRLGKAVDFYSGTGNRQICVGILLPEGVGKEEMIRALRALPNPDRRRVTFDFQRDLKTAHLTRGTFRYP